MDVVDIKRLFIILSVLFLLVSSVSAATVPSLAGTSARIYGSLSSQSPDPAEPGTYVELRFNIVNEGGTEKNVEFELLPSDPLYLLETDNGIRKIGTILGNQNDENGITLYYKLRVAESATSGDATVKLRYKRSSGAYVQFEDFSVRIREDEAFLTIDSLYTDPIELLPGRPGYVQVGLTNYAGFSMRNIRLTLDTTDVPFSGYESSNEKFISWIPPGETIFQTFPIIVDGDAVSQTHDTPILVEYQDDLGNDYSRYIEVGIIVNEPPKYLLNIEESTVAYKDQTGDIIFSISNTGTADINFLVTELLPADDEEYEIISAPKIYVGNLEGDDFETIKYKVHVNNVKDSVPFKLALTYKDNFNSVYHDDAELDFKIYSKSKAGSYGLAEIPGLAAIFLNLMILVLVGAFTAFMVLDWMHNKMPRYKKILWLIIIFTPGIGPLIYYFLGRKKAEL